LISRPTLPGPVLVSWLLLASLAVVLLFSPGMTPSFSSDDYVHLAKNIFYRDFFQALSVFTEFDGREYRPLVRLSLWLNYQMGETAVPFHYTNLFLHIACSLCVYGILRSLSPSLLGAAAGSLLFALHPIHTTNVFFIMGRTDLVCALFYFLAVLFFLKHLTRESRSFYLLALVSFQLGLLSKEMAASVPFTLFAITALHGEATWRDRLLSATRKTAVFLVVLSTYMAVRIYFWSQNDDNVGGYVNYSFFGILRNLVQWATGLGYPFDLYQLRHLLETKPGLAALLAAIYCLVGFLALSLIAGRNFRVMVRSRLTWLAMAWFFLTLMPLFGGLAHRWYLYIPSASIAVAILAIAQDAKRKRLLIASTVGACVLGGMEILRQAHTWQRQNEASEAFFLELERKGLHELPAFYFANIPFGYESAFLFSGSSLKDAMYLRWGKQQEVYALSHLNLTEGTTAQGVISDDRVSIEMQPNPYSFFVFPVGQRRFVSPGEVIRSYGANLTLDTLSPSGTVSHYSIDLPSDTSPRGQAPFFYFDGVEIQRLR